MTFADFTLASDRPPAGGEAYTNPDASLTEGPMFSPKTAASARMAVGYITFGALLVVWTVIWYIYLQRHDASDRPYYWCAGFFFTGVTFIVIGLAVGRIGRQARHADIPPPEALVGMGEQAKAAAVQSANTGAPVGVPAVPAGQPGVAPQVPQVVVPVAVPPAQPARR
jgi:hypothetical protein